MARKPYKSMDERRAELHATEFPPTAPQLTEVQIWQKKLREDKIARNEALKKRKPKPTRVFKKTPAIMAELCRRVAEGEAVHAICEDYHMPDRTTIYTWAREDEVFADMYRQCFAERGEKFAEETTLLADEAREAPPELTGAYRLAVETRRWVASRLLPKKYGDKVTLAGDAENPLAVQHVAASNELLSKIRGEGN
jgi:hypothetical protein